MSYKEERQRIAEEKQEKLFKLAENIEGNRIDYILETVSREVKKEKRLILQILYTLFSIYTDNPINLAINAPSGEGKTYVLMKVKNYFPKLDIVELAGMSEKSLFHKKGEAVIRMSEDSFVPASIYMNQLKEQMEEVNSNLKTEKDAARKMELRSEKIRLEDEMSDLENESMKKISLENKCLIFLDTPNQDILENIMPLLSHDQKRVFYEYADKNNTNNISTQSNLIEGWPGVVYCQAIDTSDSNRWPELARRFLICNPEMTEDKYKEAIEYTFTRLLPNKVYNREILDKDRMEKTEAVVADVIRNMRLYFIGREETEVIAPFYNILASSFSNTSFGMMTSDKISRFLKLTPVVNIQNRPRLVIGEIVIPFCTFDDLKITMELTEFIYGGVRPYVLQWYITVFNRVFKRNERELNFHEVKKKMGDKEITVEEKFIVVTVDDLIAQTKETEKGINSISLKKKYLNSLLYNGYIEELDSDVDHRKKVYRPNETLYAINKYDVKEGKLIPHKKIILPTDKFDVVLMKKNYIKDEILRILEHYEDYKLLDYDGTEISVDEIVDKYYSDIEDYFEVREPKSEEEVEEIINTKNENINNENENEESSKPKVEGLDKFNVVEESNKPSVEYIICKKCSRKYLETDSHECNHRKE